MQNGRYPTHVSRVKNGRRQFNLDCYPPSYPQVNHFLSLTNPIFYSI